MMSLKILENKTCKDLKKKNIWKMLMSFILKGRLTNKYFHTAFWSNPMLLFVYAKTDILSKMYHHWPSNLVTKCITKHIFIMYSM